MRFSPVLRTPPRPRNRRRQRVAPVVGHRGSLLSTARPISTAAELLKSKQTSVLSYATLAELRGSVYRPKKGKEKRYGDGWRHLQETEGSDQLCLKPAGSDGDRADRKRGVEAKGPEAVRLGCVLLTFDLSESRLPQVPSSSY